MQWVLYSLFFFVLRPLWAHLRPPTYIAPRTSEDSGNGLVEESASWGCAFSCSAVSVSSQSATLGFRFVLPAAGLDWPGRGKAWCVHVGDGLIPNLPIPIIPIPIIPIRVHQDKIPFYRLYNYLYIK